jgi:predicted AlkP superfamily phosphohydrolase/phosphomutase
LSKIRTLFIGLDGATFSVLDPLMEAGCMPFLKTFLAGGARAKLRTITPALTPPAWTSLMTGRRPGQHGVFDFFRLQSRDSVHIRFFTSNDIQTSTIWSIADAHKLRVTALNFPAMFPAPRLGGYVIPGWVPWRQLRLACWPSDLFDRLKTELPSFNPRELAMDISLEERATEGCANQDEYAPWIEMHTRREENWFDIFRHLSERDASDLTAVVFDGVDKLQHLCWRFICPEAGRPLSEPWEIRARELCLDYFRRLDSILERMCGIAGPAATVIIGSDHGFQGSRDVFHVNAWLAERGYLAWSEAAAAESNDRLLGVGQVARHSWKLDWSRTKAFAATPTSNGIYIVVNRDGRSPGVAPEEYEAFRNRLIEELREVRDPENGRALIANVWTREEIFAGPHGDVAPDLTLEMHDGGLVSILPGAEVLSRRPVISGVHAPLGVFGARGPGIREGVNLGELSILDIAPIILQSLDLPMEEGMRTKVPSELYRNGVLSAKPVRVARAAAATHLHTPENGGPTLTEEDEQIVLERLRQLGYVE